MNRPNPAIVAQAAVRRLPRAALALFCLAYVLPGFIDRAPWRSDDITAFGYMVALAGGATSWMSPQIMGIVPEVDALLPYWLGAWAIQLAPSWMDSDFAARVPFIGLLIVTLIGTWYGTYQLARSPQAQPLPFAFGGEALPTDYARAVADGALLALIACLGLAQPAHETTPILAQLGFSALAFYGFAAFPNRHSVPLFATAVGLGGLVLSGAPTLATLLGLGGSLTLLLDTGEGPAEARSAARLQAATMAALTLLAAFLASTLQLWHWRIALPPAAGQTWLGIGNLLVWFTWPAWPLALWTLWRWRRHLVRHLSRPSRHLVLPLWFVLVTLGTTVATASPERTLLLALPALAAMAAFALPTLERPVAALIDWFTLLFFSGCALIIWLVWVAMQTGVPWQPAANVERLAPGFVPSFSGVPFLIALAASGAWLWLVHWRAGRHRTAIWKSMVLPAGGAALCWLLLMTLWLPLLDYARSYVPLVNRTLLTMRPLQTGDCAYNFGLTVGQITALEFHGALMIKPVGDAARCRWLIVNQDVVRQSPATMDLSSWTLASQLSHPTDSNDNLLIYQLQSRAKP
ncbi:MAG: hypothetical protein NT071_17680 [Burkholderiales bacterium]|nr:hypothetical protein [Burkholderiales bacterium]